MFPGKRNVLDAVGEPGHEGEKQDGYDDPHGAGSEPYEAHVGVEETACRDQAAMTATSATISSSRLDGDDTAHNAAPMPPIAA